MSDFIHILIFFGFFNEMMAFFKDIYLKKRGFTLVKCLDNKFWETLPMPAPQSRTLSGLNSLFLARI
jgi:hypothetical protein